MPPVAPLGAYSEAQFDEPDAGEESDAEDADADNDAKGGVGVANCHSSLDGPVKSHQERDDQQKCSHVWYSFGRDGAKQIASPILYQIFTKKSIPGTLLQMKKFQVITLFPDMFSGVFKNSMMWKAQKDSIVELSTIDLRQFGLGPRKTVDDTPYGGGDGMLLRIEPLWAAVQQAKANDPTAKVLLMTPRGQRWKQALAQTYSESDCGYIFICGRYEGYDERILKLVDEEVSVGDYVLTGGELPAMTIVDSIVRLLPGVLGGETSAEIESFSDGETLEFPQYTRPEVFEGMKVPDVLLSGHHGEIAKWRSANSRKAEL